jgi:uncharacterized protein (TIGR03067 family)
MSTNRNRILATLVFTVLLAGFGWIAQHTTVAQEPGVKKDVKPADKDEERRKGDQEKLQGAWKMVSARAGGQDVGKEEWFSLSFQGDKIRWQTRFTLGEGAYQLLRAGKPRAIDISLGEFRKIDRFGIYEIDGDKLTLCLTHGLEGDREKLRPSEFKAEKKMRGMLYVLEREPRAKDGPKPQDQDERKREIRLRAGFHLQEITNAMWDYWGDHECFPPVAFCDKEGRPLLSWRVALLPYLGQEDLYKQFKLNEPWDSAHNKKLLGKIPMVYEPVVGPDTEKHSTCFQVFTGAGTVFELGKKIGINDLTRGTSRTMFILEAREPVPWTKPADIPYDPDKKLPEFWGGIVDDGLFLFTTADGYLRAKRNVIDEKILRACILREGKEVRDPEELDR